MKPTFTNKEKGYKLPFIGAMKDGETYETEAECKTRIKDMFDVDDVECFWNEERVPPGFQAGPIPDKADSKDEPEEDKPGPTDQVVIDEVEIQAETQPETVDSNPPKKGFHDEKEDSEEVLPDSVDDSVVNSDDPIPSVDGSRSYDIGKSPGLVELAAEFSRWPWTDGSDSLLEKLQEETTEAIEGNSTEPSIDGNVITVNGKSSVSEMITVGIIAFKYLHAIHNVTPKQMVSLMVLRAQEQYDRYHNTQDKLDSEDPQDPASPPSDESEEDN